MLERRKLDASRVELKGFLPLGLKIVAQQTLAVLRGQKLIMQAVANVCDFVGDAFIQPLKLRLQLLHLGKSAAKLSVELGILRLEVGFLRPQGLQGSAGDDGGDQFGVASTGKAVAGLFNNAISLGIGQLRVQVAQPVDHDIIIFVRTQNVVLLLKLGQSLLRLSCVGFQSFHLFRKPIRDLHRPLVLDVEIALQVCVDNVVHDVHGELRVGVLKADLDDPRLRQDFKLLGIVKLQGSS